MAVTLFSHPKEKLNSGCLRKTFCRKYLYLKPRKLTGHWKNVHKDDRHILNIVQCNLSDHVKENEKARYAVGVSEISWMWHHVKEQACSVSNASDLYSKSVRFECWLGLPLYLMTFFVVSLGLFRKLQRQHFQFKTYPFVSFPIQYSL